MNKIRELRKEKGLTMKALGAIFSLSESTISLYENGKHYPDIETMQKFADFFGVTVDYLLGREEVQQKTPVAAQLSGDRAELFEILQQFTEEEIQRFKDFASGVLAGRK